MVKNHVRAVYGDRVRVRVGAIIPDEPSEPGAVVLVEHEGLDDKGPFWTPPGGEVQFGESLAEAAVREVEEETGLIVEVERLLYTLDFIRPPLHAVSFYFLCRAASSNLRPGTDPELGTSQLIRRAEFVSFSRLKTLQVYPEGLSHLLPGDARSGFGEHPKHLGTKR